MTKEMVKAVILANMFDGQPGGIVTMEVDVLVEEIAEIIVGFFGNENSD